MNLSVLPKKVAEFIGALVVIFFLYATAREMGLQTWTAQEAEGITLLVQLIGDIYAVLLAFMIFVIWTQFSEVENCVAREADSLVELLRYSAYLHDDARGTIRKATAVYVRQVVGQEWTELGEGRKDRQAGEAFSKVVAAVVYAAPKNANEEGLKDHLMEALRTLSRNRDERISKSLTRMPPTLSALVRLIAGVLFLLIFLYPVLSTVCGVRVFGRGGDGVVRC